MANEFAGLIAEINNITAENKKGNRKARLNTGKFEGSRKEAAEAINLMLNTIAEEKETSDMKQLMVDSAPIVITVFDKDLNILDCNEEALRRYGLQSKEEYAANFFDTSPEYQPDGLLSVEKGKEALRKCMKEGYVQFEWMHKTIDNEPLPSEIICLRVRDNDEDVMLTYAIDLRELKKTEKKSLEKAYEAEAAKANSQMKSRFLARMSHEIRTPIAAVLGISEIHLRGKSLPLDLEEAFAKIHNSSSILLGIVNDILDLSKIEAGKMSVVNEKYDVISMLSDVVQLNLTFIGSKKIDFIIDISEQLPCGMIGDELRVKQILNNLLSNAFKYTQGGFVKLSIAAEPGGNEENITLVINIADTGRGMTPEQLEALFEEYTRFIDKEINFSEGTGLGMPITYNLLQLMDGSIDVQSKAGEGTSVTVQIPQKQVGSNLLGKEAVKRLKEFKTDLKSVAKKLNFVLEPMPYGKVLVVDDVDTNLYVAKGLLSMYELKVETCESGFEAIDKIKNGNAYDIIFMDHMMPDLDGIETTRMLRDTGYTLPIVALTANALIGQAEEFLKNGFDGFISKPIQATHLDVVLTRFIKAKHMPEAGDLNLEDMDIDFSDFDDEDQNSNEFTASPEMMERIRRDFLDSQRNAFAEITLAINKSDMKTAHRLAHNLKNMAGLLNDKALTEVAESVEKMLKSGESPQSCHMNRLEKELTRVIEGLL